MITLLLALQSPSADALLRQAENLYRSTRDYSVVANSKDLRFDIDASASSVIVRVRVPAKGTKPATDRTYGITGPELIGLDNLRGQYTRTATPGQTLAQRMQEVRSMFDLPVGLHTDPETAKLLFGRVRSAQPKLVAPRTITAGGTGKGRILMKFDAEARLTTLALGEGATALNWTFRYSPPRKIKFGVPKGYVLVDSFTEVRKAPRFADATAKATLERCFRVYDRLASVKYQVTTDAGDRTVEMRPGLVRQTGPEGSWAWDGKSATLRDRNGAVKAKGKAKLEELAARIAAKGGVVDETLRQILTRQNPARKAFGPDLSVRSTGELVIASVPCVALEGNQRGVRVTALVRKSDGLLARLTLENLDGRGKVVSRSDRVFKYL